MQSVLGIWRYVIYTIYSDVYSGALGLYSVSIEDGLYKEKHAGYVPHILKDNIVMYFGSN